jgi:hypothetical protein
LRYFIIYSVSLFLINTLASQNINRKEVNGLIFANTNDIEGVTIYNTSSNKGTITNAKGEFVIAIAVNDIIEISALQFQPQTITITKDVLVSNTLKIFLAEQVNQLDAILLSSGLSGNLAVDIDNAEIAPKIEFNLGNMNALEFHDDKSMDNTVITNALNSITNKGGLYNGVNFAGLFNSLIKSKKKSNSSNNESLVYNKPKILTDIYSHKQISETFNMPNEKVEAFVAFLESNGIPQTLLEDKNEFKRIDFILQQRELFMSLPNDKN